jgi:hypothetical protein
MLKGKELMERGMGNVVREAVEEKQDVSSHSNYSRKAAFCQCMRQPQTGVFGRTLAS